MIRFEIIIYLTLSKIIFIFCEQEGPGGQGGQEDPSVKKLENEIKNLESAKTNLTSTITEQKTKLEIYSLYIFALICAVIILFIIIIIIIIYEFIQNIKREKNKSVLLESYRKKKSQEIYNSKNSQNSKSSGGNENIINNSNNSNIIKNININNININGNNNENNYIENEENNDDDEPADKPRTESMYSEKSGYEAPCIGAVIKNKEWTNDGEEHNFINGNMAAGNPYSK